MLKFQIWDRKTPLRLPSGEVIGKPEQITPQNLGVASAGQIVIGQDRDGIVWRADNLGVLCSNYGISDALSDEEALAAIVEIWNTPEPEPEPSAEERNAAALELQNLLAYGVAPSEEIIQKNYARGLWNETGLSKAVAAGALASERFQVVTGHKFVTDK